MGCREFGCFSICGCELEINAISEQYLSSVQVWDVNTLENLATFTGHQDGINAVITLDNDRIATAASDKTIKVIFSYDLIFV